MEHVGLRVLQTFPSLGTLEPATLARHVLPLLEILPSPRSLRLPIGRYRFPVPMDSRLHRLPMVKLGVINAEWHHVDPSLARRFGIPHRSLVDKPQREMPCDEPHIQFCTYGPSRRWVPTPSTQHDHKNIFELHPRTNLSQHSKLVIGS